MNKPKWNYDGDEFYKVIEGLGKVHAADCDIATVLDLDADTFGAMKNGNYIGWTKEENERRSARILGVLL